MVGETGSRWYQVPHDNVLFEATQLVDFTERCRFGEHTGRILARGGRNEAVRFKRSFRDAKQYGNGFRWFATLFDDLFVFLFEVKFVYLIVPHHRSIVSIAAFPLAQNLTHDKL